MPKDNKQKKQTLLELAASMKERIAKLTLPKPEKKQVIKPKEKDEFVNPFIIIEGATRNKPI